MATQRKNATRAIGAELVVMAKTGSAVEISFGGLTSIGELSAEREKIDVTTLADVAGKRFIPGAVEVGDLDIEGNIEDYAEIEKVMALFEAGEVRKFEIRTTEDGDAVYKFDASLTKFAVGERTVDGFNTYSATLSINGMFVRAKKTV